MKARGFVLNRNTGEPVSGVNVVARAKRNGTTTSLGLLTTDEAGYVSFDLSGVVDSTALEGVSLEVVGQPDSAATVGGEELNGERPASVPSTDGAVVLRVDPARMQTVATPARPAVQEPDARDWELSPASFVTPRAVALGEGACTTPVRSALPAHQIRFVQIVRRPTQPVLPPTYPQPAPAGGGSQVMVEGAPGRVEVSNPLLDPISPAADVMLGVLRCDILEYEQTWQDIGESLGTILYSLPLAPCESVKIAVIEAERSDEAARSDAIDARENLTHSLFRDRNIAETVKGVLRESQGGSSFMAGQGAAYSGSWQNVGTFGVTHAIGYATSQSWGNRNLDANSAQDLHDSTVQNTDYVRSLNSTVIVQGTQAERHQLETRTITNHNHCHALTVQYYEVLRRMKLETRLVGSRPGVLIPYQGLRFKSPRPTIEERDTKLTPRGEWYKVLVDPDRDDLHLVNRLRPMLESSLVEPRLVANFEAIRRLLFFEGTTPPEVQGPPSWEYNVEEIKVTLLRGQWGTDPDSVSMRLRVRGSTPSYASYEKPYRPYRDMENNKDRVILESNDLLKDYDKPEETGELGPWKFTLATPTLRSDLTEFEIHFDPGKGGSDFSLKGLKATATKPDGTEEVLVDESSNTVFNGEGFERFRIPRPTVAPTTDPKNGDKDHASSSAEQRGQDVALAWELITHLYDHRDTYAPRLVAMKEPMWFAEALDWAMGRGAARDNIDSVPVAISGQHIAFAYHGDNASTTTSPPAAQPPAATIVSLPTRGVLAEAQLGNCNACEKRDVTRFWKWEESPCEQAPAIEGITPGFRGQPTTVDQGQLPNAVVQITQPPAAPDPVGLAAALNLLGKGDAFRDMSGSAELQQLLSGLASGAMDLVKAQQLAGKVAQSQSQAATSRGGPAAASEPDASKQIDRLDAIDYAKKRDLIGSDQASRAAEGVLGGAVASADTDLFADAVPYWNAYIYVVGSDVSGKSDFNVMRKKLMDMTDLITPSVVITYDYHSHQLRKSWKRSDSEQPKNQTFPLGDDFILYTEIAAMASRTTVKQLHFLTHSAHNTILYAWQRESTVTDLKALDPAFSMAFDQDSIVKIHGCDLDQAILAPIAAFCNNGAGATTVLPLVRGNIEASYPRLLAEAAGVPVWAAPAGAGAITRCSYLPDDQAAGRRFCIEIDPNWKIVVGGKEFEAHGYPNTIKFYEANYGRIFTRAAGEKIFDCTFHMKYKPVLSAASPGPAAACAASLPAPTPC